MTKEQYNEYLKAVDIVCFGCLYAHPLVCSRCRVRRTCDKLKETMKEGTESHEN